MQAFPILVAATLLLAGCLQPSSAPPSPGPRSAGGSVAVTHGWRIAPVGMRGTEPSIGMARDGTIFVGGVGGSMTNDGVARSRDGGRTWTSIFDPRQTSTDVDPWIWLDPLTQRLYNAPLAAACNNMAWTDDGGATWAENPAGGCGLPGHDHQKVTTGPPVRGVVPSGYPNVVYYAYNSFRPAQHAPDTIPQPGTGTGFAREGTQISVSLDGGKTWGLPVLADGTDDCHAGVNGPVAVGPDGTAILAKGTCAGTDIVVSGDSGKTWAVRARVTSIGSFPDFAYDPATAFDSQGNAYVAMLGQDGAAYLTTSRDDGATWSLPGRVSTLDTTATAFLAMAVGAPGYVAVATIETSSPAWASLAPSVAPPSTVWHLRMAWATDGLNATPSFTSERVTPEKDPVQVGCIWLRGVTYSGGATTICRNMGDFIDMHALQGRPYVVYTDGCASCVQGTQSTASDVVVATPESGPSLLGGELGPVLSPT